MEFLKTIYEKICAWFVIRQFVFRFDEYNGTEDSNDIYNENVYEYEFINQGTTVISINGGLKLYPKYANIEPTRIVMSIRDHEKDATVYQYTFEPLDLIAVTAPFRVSEELTITAPGLVPGKDFGIGGNDAIVFNKLIVKSKLKDQYLDKHNKLK